MKRVPWNWMVVIAALAAALPAHAQHRRFLRERAGDERPPLERRAAPQRDFSQDEAQRGDGYAGRMSPDERRQLRRDIHDAGRELYRRDRRPPR